MDALLKTSAPVAMNLWCISPGLLLLALDRYVSQGTANDEMDRCAVKVKGRMGGEITVSGIFTGSSSIYVKCL